MIPLKLQLKNFLSYGPEIQTVEFGAYPLICLSGKNGHGKSALLDAITWALWGQARKTFGVAKADQGLVYLGQTHMLVILDFIFNEQPYRIRREFSISYGKAVAALDFGMIDIQTNNFISLTDKTIKTTQEKIERMLNLDMESFVNSAFLRQGQANEFSKKSAKDRKTVLATILGLNRYESLRTLAGEKAKEALNAKNIQGVLQEKRLHELNKKNEILTELKEQELNIAHIAEQEKEFKKVHQELEKEQLEIIEKRKEYAVICNEQSHLHKKEGELQESLISTMQIWRKTHRQLLAVSDNQHIETKKALLIQTINVHQQQLQKGLEIKTELLSTKETAHTRSVAVKNRYTALLQEKNLQIEQLLLEQKNNELKLKEAHVNNNLDTQKIDQLTKEYTQLEQTIKQSNLTERNAVFLEKQFDKRREYYQTFIAQGNYIKEKLAELAQKKRMVQDENNPSCPLCEQNLSASRKRFLNETLYQSEQFLTHRLTRLSKIITSLKAILLAQHIDIKTTKELQEIIKQRDIVSHAHTIKQEAIKSYELAQKKILDALALSRIEYEEAIKRERVTLQEDPELMLLSAKINALEKELATLTYDKEKHAHAQQELLALEQSLQLYKELDQQKSLQEERKQSIESLCITLKSIKKQKNAITIQLQTLSPIEKQSLALAERAGELSKQMQELNKRKESFLHIIGSLENQKQKLALIETEFQQEQKNINALIATIDDYHIIANATGKNGIQALLIEEAIPEIENEANQLLARLTNNQSHILIESLRDLKSGGTKETLDIKISDSIGIRPYELFSGGEAFRIDFALRIAISKLLARRAGTSLQTLIIDEGFGSQDEEGLGHIMDALYKIQDDFAKIIIVSHLPAMKDQFPVHFLVEKNAQGSCVRVMEQG